MTSVIAVVSDLHVNSTLGLCPPQSRLDDGATIKCSKSQKWLWDMVWLSFWRDVRRVRDSVKAESVYFVSLGDWGDINVHSKAQLFTTNDAVVVSAMVDALEPARDVVTEYIIVRGTEAHCGPACYLEEIAAKTISADGRRVLVDEDTGAYSHPAPTTRYSASP